MRKLLIANRGEIVLRIIRTSKKLNLKTVTIFSDGDRNNPHAKAGDEYYCIGPSRAEQSYLSIPRILEVARVAGADAIHPGYGFLSENANFAEAVRAAGLLFVGPSAEVMRQLGRKDYARKQAESVGLKLAPGFAKQGASLLELAEAAKELGTPLLIKAACGGGGRGMRKVYDLANINFELDSAAREAQAFFGDGSLILERIVRPARHVEVQVIGDSSGNVIHLFERDCSLQRRHQKIIEETPAIGITKKTLDSMYKGALDLASKVGLVGAATVEYLVSDSSEFYFLEVNPRIQVEHPITESVTGLDIVELQLRIARGENLPIKQSAISREGCAIEARVCAETVSEGLFRPSSGRIVHVLLPPTEKNVRVEHALSRNSVVSTDYDSLLAKLIVKCQKRQDAINSLKKLLEQTIIIGVDTNIPFLIRLLDSELFKNSEHDTDYINSAIAELCSIDSSKDTAKIALAAYFACLSYNFKSTTPVYWRMKDDRVSLTYPILPYRLSNREVGILELSGRLISVEKDNGFLVEIDQEKLMVRIDEFSNSIFKLNVNGSFHIYALHIDSPADLSATALLNSQQFNISPANSSKESTDLNKSSFEIVAKIPGTVIAVKVAAGDKVEKGDVLLTIESMKMENSILASVSGRVKEILVEQDKKISEGEKLLELELVET